MSGPVKNITVFRQGERMDKPSGTVTSGQSPSCGRLSVADTEFGCHMKNGVFKVLRWGGPSDTVIGSLDVHAGPAAVADPGIPGPDERLDPPPVIIALDGTWHRPLTTLELAALQGFPLVMPDGSPLELTPKSDGRRREFIGNAVPPPTAKAIAGEILTALLAHDTGRARILPFEPVWVRRDEDEREIRA